MKKILSLVLALCAITAFACQYPEVDDDQYGMSVRYIYLAGVNAVTNHMSDITMQGGSTIDPQLKYTAYNNMTVDLPLTVYIATADITADGNNPLELKAKDLELTLQYRVLPSTTWHTVTTTRVSNLSNSLLAGRRKLFGARIDTTVGAGSTMLIRVYITAAKYKFDQNLQKVLTVIENADPDSPVVTSAADVPDTATYHRRTSTPQTSEGGAITGGGYTRPEFVGLTAPGGEEIDLGSTTMYLDGWMPQHVIAVKISGKRRPQ